MLLFTVLFALQISTFIGFAKESQSHFEEESNLNEAINDDDGEDDGEEEDETESDESEED